MGLFLGLAVCQPRQIDNRKLQVQGVILPQRKRVEDNEGGHPTALLTSKCMCRCTQTHTYVYIHHTHIHTNRNAVRIFKK